MFFFFKEEKRGTYATLIRKFLARNFVKTLGKYLTALFNSY